MSSAPAAGALDAGRCHRPRRTGYWAGIAEEWWSTISQSPSRLTLAYPTAMAWVLFGLGFLFFLALGRAAGWSRATPAQPDRFPDMETCRTALPELIRHHEGQENGPPVVMGKCHLILWSAPPMVPPETELLARSVR